MVLERENITTIEGLLFNIPALKTDIEFSYYLVSISESRPNTIGRGPAQVGATAAMAAGFTKPFFAARIVIVAACPPPKTTMSFSDVNTEDD